MHLHAHLYALIATFGVHQAVYRPPEEGRGGWKGTKNTSLWLRSNVPSHARVSHPLPPSPTPPHPTLVYEYARTHACAFARDLPLSYPYPLIGIPYYPHARSDVAQISVTPGRIPVQERGRLSWWLAHARHCRVRRAKLPRLSVHLPFLPPFISPCFPPLLRRRFLHSRTPPPSDWVSSVWGGQSRERGSGRLSRFGRALELDS